MVVRQSIVALLLLASSVSAAETFPLKLEFDSDGTVSLAGDIRAQASLAGIMYHPDHAAAGEVTLNVSGAHVVVMLDRQVSVKGPNFNFSNFLPLESEPEEEFDFTGTMRIVPGADATVNLLPHNRNESVSVHLHRQELVFTDEGGVEPQGLRVLYGGRRLIPDSPSLRTTSTGEALGMASDVVVLAYNSEIFLTSNDGNRVVETGDVHTAATPSPDGETRVAQYDRRYAVIFARDASATLTGAPGTWQLHVRGIEAAITGGASFTGIRDFKGEPLPPDPAASLIQLEGALNLRAQYADTLHWTVTGQGTYLGVDGVATHGTKGLAFNELVAITGGIGLLGLLAWLVKRAVGSGATAWLAYNASEPFANPTRLRLLALVAQNPGITASQLGRALLVRRASIMFHSQILAEAGCLKMQRQGLNWHFVLAQPFPRVADRTNETWAAPVSALACLQQPLRRAITNCLVASAKGLTAAQLSRCLQESGKRPRFSLLAYHLSLLIKAGIVEENSSNGAREYSATSLAFNLSKPTAVQHAVTENGALLGQSPMGKAWKAMVSSGFVSREPSGSYSLVASGTLGPSVDAVQERAS